MATKKLFYEDSHQRCFVSRVVSCEKTGSGFEVVLDSTAFYPEGGGQSADTGHLGPVRVLDTRERDGEVIHLCDGPLVPGQTVQGRIAWEDRFTRMQQHSGEHIVSGILHRRYGVNNTGFHMGAERTVIDFDGVIPPEALPEIEAEANRFVWENLPVKCWYPEEAELSSIPYRSKKALSWPVRIVEFPGADICACCGTHVSATGEIGLIKLFSAVPFRGGTRMEMACGTLALEYLNRVLGQAAEVSHLFSAPADQIGAAARSFATQLAAQKGRCVELQRRLFSQLAQKYVGAGNVLLIEPGLDSTGIRELADCVAKVCGALAAVFSGEDATGYGYCLACPTADIRPLGREMTAALSGRGGGKPDFQQGRVNCTAEEIRAFFERSEINVQR